MLLLLFLICLFQSDYSPVNDPRWPRMTWWMLAARQAETVNAPRTG